MLKKAFFLFFLISLTGHLRAQIATAKGKIMIDNTEDFDTYLRIIEGVGSSARDLLAEQSLKSYMMPPRKYTGTHSSTYAFMAALEFYTNLNSNYKDNLSPDYIHLNITSGNADEELAFLVNTGTVSASVMPFESSALTPSVAVAAKYKIRQYVKLFQPTTRPQQKLFDLRKAITRGNPVVVELQITNEFKTLRQTRFWQAAAGDKTPAGTHYVVAVGFDEERRAVEVLNCWGREWGSGGYVWISYDDFSTLANNAYVLIP